MDSAFERFKALHEARDAFIMPNAWDGASAVLLKRAGFKALASSSIAIAFALGRHDGLHQVSREEAIDNAALIHRVTDLPVNGDLEDGFGPEPQDCADTVRAAIAAGLAGLGIEDTTANPDAPIHGFDAAVARVRAAADAARGRIMLTGRTDNLLHDVGDVDETIRRLVAFAEAGADVLFAPGLPDMESIASVVRAVAPKPVNVVVGPGSGLVALAQLASAGVKRVSLGGAPYRVAMQALDDTARALAQGDIPVLARAMPSSTIDALIPPA